jgi:hypothetical protein
MKMTLFEHGKDCTPLFPCKACEIVSWLRSTLDAKDFATLIDMVNGLEAPKKKRVYRRKGDSRQPTTADNVREATLG